MALQLTCEKKWSQYPCLGPIRLSKWRLGLVLHLYLRTMARSILTNSINNTLLQKWHRTPTYLYLSFAAKLGQGFSIIWRIFLVPCNHWRTYHFSFQLGGRTGPWEDVEYRSGSLPSSQYKSLPPSSALHAYGTDSYVTWRACELLRPRLNPCTNLVSGHVWYDSKYFGPKWSVVG